jgi:hypothetical protein
MSEDDAQNRKAEAEMRGDIYYPPPSPKRDHDIDNTTPARALSRVDSE